MTLMNLTDLPEDVLKTEFPQIWMQMQQQKVTDQSNSDKKNIFLDQDNNQFYLQKNGSDIATRYNLIDLNRAILRPQFTDDAHLSADHLISNWGALDDENIFDTTNHNWDEIKDYFQAIIRKINSQNDFLRDIGPYLDELAKKKDINLSEIVADGVDGYYSKSEVDKKVDFLQKQINNINHYIGDKPQPNSNFAKGFTGNPDYNDKIMDSNVEGKIENLNTEDEEGDSDGK